MISSLESEIIIRLILAAICGVVLGFEREKLHKPAGIRTHALVTMGAALFTVLSITAFPGSDSSRIAAGIVTGIGFLGAGTIFRSKIRVVGLTTAANMWVAAAVGMALGSGMYVLGVIVTIISFIILQTKRVEEKLEEEIEFRLTRKRKR